MNIRKISKNLGVRHNVSFRVIDEITGDVISEHIGHNSATNSLLTGIGHYLKGDGVLNQGSQMLSHYIPRYISLGTMGLLNQEEDPEGLPDGIGVIDYTDKIYGDISDDNLAAIGLILSENDPSKYPNKILDPVQATDRITPDKAKALRYIDYLNQSPGFGADGYGNNVNNNRRYSGLGPIFSQRQTVVLAPESTKVIVGDVNGDKCVNYEDLLLLIDYVAGKVDLNSIQRQAANVTANTLSDDEVDAKDIQALATFLEKHKGKSVAEVTEQAEAEFGSFTWTAEFYPTVNCELISDSFPRAAIGYRDLVPEAEAEFPKTIDVVFSAMISTGALAQFREPGKDYIFITEAGLWSEKSYTSEGEGDNGLLAAYRIAPPNKTHWDMQVAANQKRLQKEVLKVGKNQVVQVIWKIQLGSIDQFEGIESLYPSTETLKWIEHGALLATVDYATLEPGAHGGWTSEVTKAQLGSTYDTSPSNGIKLTYQGDACIVYKLDRLYTVNRISVLLKKGSSSHNNTKLKLEIMNSQGAYTSYGSSIDLQNGLNEDINIFNVPPTDDADIDVDTQYVKLTFEGRPSTESEIEILEVQIFARDSERGTELHTSLTWNEY